MLENYMKLESTGDLIPRLRGRVFHVTPTENMIYIEKSGALLPNTNGERISLFGNTDNGFFRLQGCVSFFDYRKYGSKEWVSHAHKCRPTQLLRYTPSLSILFLMDNEFHKLMPWTKWKEDEKWSERVVPHIETGYPGPVALKCFSEHLVIEQSEIVRPPIAFP